MELRQLRYFVRVVELGSMGRAATELGVVTSAPSQQISRLEGELATRLLQRTRAGVRPTEAGLAFLRQAQLSLRHADHAAAAEIDSLPLLMRCVADGIGATIKPMVAIHALGDTPARWRALRVADTALTRTNHLYALPPQKLSPCAAAVRDELRRVVRELAELGEWQGMRLSGPGPVRRGADAGEVQPVAHAAVAPNLAAFGEVA